MKRQYIRQVKRELNWSPSVRRKVARDLDEAFASALEHGETERQVIERLGTPQEFAESIAEQFGVDRAARARRRGFVASGSALAVAAAAFALYAGARPGWAPEGAIGQADAMTNLQVVGTFGLDVPHIALAAGVLAACIAVVLILGTIRKKGGNI